MDERFQAIELAHKLLDEPNCDPDDDLRVLSRQLLRRHEQISKLQQERASAIDRLAPLGLENEQLRASLKVLHDKGTGGAPIEELRSVCHLIGCTDHLQQDSASAHNNSTGE